MAYDRRRASPGMSTLTETGVAAGEIAPAFRGKAEPEDPREAQGMAAAVVNSSA